MGPLDLIPTPYKIMAAAVAVVLVLGATYAKGRADGKSVIQAKWDTEKLVQKDAALEAEGENRDTEKGDRDKVIEAQNEAKKREQTLRSERDAARRVADSLRHDIDALRGQLPGTTAEACHEHAAALADVFGECTIALESVAGAADGHASDSLTFDQAWPDHGRESK